MNGLRRKLAALFFGKQGDTGNSGPEIQLFRLAFNELNYWECWTNSHINVRFGQYGLPPKTRVLELNDDSIVEKIEALRNRGYVELPTERAYILELTFSSDSTFGSRGFSRQREAVEKALGDLLTWYDFGEWIGGAVLDNGFEVALAVREPSIAEYLVREHAPDFVRAACESIRVQT